MKIEVVKIDELKPAEYNPRKDLKPEDEEYQRIKKSIEMFGYVAPIIVNKDKTVIGGHQRLKILKELGCKDIECVVVDLNKDNEKALNISLNNNSGKWDTLKLEDLIKELSKKIDDLSVTGFSEDELEDILKNDIELEEEFDVEVKAKEIKAPITKKGNVWILGKHRLMCGDSKDIKDVTKLMNGNIAKCLFTSPPYNMNNGMYENYTDNLESQKYIEFNLEIIKTWNKFLKGYLFWNISYNKNSRWEFIEIMYRILKETNLKFMELIVWDKGHGMPIVSKEMLTRQYEDILMFGDKDEISKDMELFYLGTTEQRGYFNKKKGKGISNYWRITTGNTQLDNHKACFPIELPSKAIELTTERNDIIVDCFGGSGTTLIACENKNRVCYMMELDPVYCDVIKERWEKLTGKKAILE